MDIAFLFKKYAPVDIMDKALEECNAVLIEDFGPGHRIEPEYTPDLLVVCREVELEGITSKVAGLLTVHYTEASKAWELGTMSVRKPYSHGVIFKNFMEQVPVVIVEDFMKDDTTPAWLVKRVKQDNKVQINTLKRFGFEEPAHFMIGVLSNDGYIPFDPFDEVLMKRRLCPPLLARLEADQGKAVVFST